MARIDRYDRLKNRRLPTEKQFGEALRAFSATEVDRDYRYLVESMQPIDPEYTENTFAEADRVRSQLATRLPSKYSAEFDYQGSVTSDTHIRIHSDIDLLAVHSGFISLDPEALNINPYTGNSMTELLAMRSDTAIALRAAYREATVGATPGKAIAISGGSLRRKIDVIVGNWWHSATYQQYKQKVVRGINILDSKVPRQLKNLPFLHNYRIDEKDNRTRGLRKVIRLLKTLKYDAEPELKISSYDIAALAWNMSTEALAVTEGNYLQLARNAAAELKKWIDQPLLRATLDVPNTTRKVFCPEGAAIAGLASLHSELHELLASIQRARANQPITFSRHTAHYSPVRPWKETRPQSVTKHSF